MTWRPPWGKGEMRCDWRDLDGHPCKVKTTFDSNGSHTADRRRLAEQGWTYDSLRGDICPVHSGSSTEGAG